MTWPSDRVRAGQRPDPRDGFSLLETLVVLAITALVVAVAAPALRDPSGRRTLDRNVVEIASLLRAARSEAVRAGAEAVVTVDVADRTVLTSWSADTVVFSPSVAVQVTGAREELLSPATPSVRFFPDGSATGGEIRLDSSGYKVRIAVDWLTGRVEWERLPDG